MLDNFNRTLKHSNFVMDVSGKNTILVAEDDEDSRVMLRNYLELEGYRVVEAEDGEKAVEIACASFPDLIIMDLNLPKLDGISASRKIRQCVNLSEVPILTNSSSGKFGMELFLNIENLGGGYLEYIPKPFDLEYLAELIRNVLLKTKKAL